MSDIQIHRTHALGMKEARRVAWAWAEEAEARLDMECTYEEGEHEDVVTFTRSGVNGELTVTAHAFELRAKLGFLLAAFRPRIEAEIEKNLDTLLGEAKLAHKAAHRSTRQAKAPAKAAKRPPRKTT